MTNRLSTVLLVVSLVSIWAQSSGSTSNNYLDELMRNYDSRLPPVLDPGRSTQVNISFHVSILRSFDVVKGELSFLATFLFEWKEERLTWNPNDYNGVTEIVLPKSEVWIPEVVMPRSINTINQPGGAAKRVRINSNGDCTMTSIDYLNVFCPADVQDYPYDTQHCRLLILPVGYKDNELKLGIPGTDRSTAVDSTEWKITDISADIVSHRFQIQVTLQRISTYAVLTMSIPVLLLGTINSLVFILPADSGERISFSITTFLSFTVYMGILTDNMPRGSNPTANIVFFVFIMLVYSTAILICTIISLRIHTNEGKKPVPKKIQQVVNFLKFSCCKRRNASVSQRKVCEAIKGQENSKAEAPKRGKIAFQHCALEIMSQKHTRSTNKDRDIAEIIEDKDTELSWTHVGSVFDNCMLIIFGIVLFVLFVNFYIILHFS